MEKEIEKIFDKYTDEEKAMLIVSEERLLVKGETNKIMNLISRMINGLIKKGFSTDLIKVAVTVGMMNKKEATEFVKKMTFKGYEELEKELNAIFVSKGEVKK